MGLDKTVTGNAGTGDLDEGGSEKTDSNTSMLIKDDLSNHMPEESDERIKKENIEADMEALEAEMEAYQAIQLQERLEFENNEKIKERHREVLLKEKETTVDLQKQLGKLTVTLSL